MIIMAAVGNDEKWIRRQYYYYDYFNKLLNQSCLSEMLLLGTNIETRNSENVFQKFSNNISIQKGHPFQMLTATSTESTE